MHGNLGYCRRLARGLCVVWPFLVLGCSSATRVGPDASSPATPVEPKRSLDASPFEVEAARDVEDVASTPRPSPPTAHAELAWLSPGHIGAAVRAHHGAFTACQTLADTSARHSEGVVTLGWLVKTDGSVADVTVGPSSFESERVNHCVLSVAKRVTFPPSSVQARVSWRVKFRGASNAPLAEAGRPSSRSH